MEIRTDIKKVAIYSRKSRPDETEEILQRQLQVLIEMADKNKWQWEVYQEVGSSMSIEERDRPELNKMLTKVQIYEYDGILVTDSDRISRDIEHSSRIKKMLANYGVKLITTTKVYDYNSQEDDLMSDMMAIVSKQEYLNTKKRLIRGKKASASQGRWQGKAPLGYKYDKEKGKLVIDEETATIVKRIYDLYIQGFSSTDIAYKLEIEGVRTPTGTLFTSSRIVNILRYEVYKGTVVYGKTRNSKTEKLQSGQAKQLPTDKEVQIRVENAHEAIISPEEWEKVAHIRQYRMSRPVASRLGKNPFSSLIQCALCGEKHSFQKDCRNGALRIQSCQTRHYNAEGFYTVCHNQGVILSEFEKGFYKELSFYIDKLEEHLETIKSNVRAEEAFDPEGEIATLNQQIKNLNAQIKKVQQAFILDIMKEEEAQSQIKKNRTQIENLEKQIEEVNRKSNEGKLESLEQFIIKLKSILTGDTHMETKEINQLFTGFIDRIEYKRVGTVKGSRKANMELKIYYK